MARNGRFAGWHVDLVESVPRPERFPAYEGLVATDRGEILVGEYAGPLGIWPMRRADQGPDMLRPQLKVPARQWLVFDPDGELIATLETPGSFEPYAVEDDMMWGVYVSDLDVELVGQGAHRTRELSASGPSALGAAGFRRALDACALTRVCCCRGRRPAEVRSRSPCRSRPRVGIMVAQRKPKVVGASPPWHVASRRRTTSRPRPSGRPQSP